MRLFIFLISLSFNLNGFCQYGTTDKFPVYKIHPDTLIKGYTDNEGLKQGSFFSYNKNGTVNFVRTYKNDTLNGFLGCYSPMGFVNSEGFYKGGKRDSIYFEYDGENNLESKEFYKNGLKHGIFLKYYPNGNLKYEGFFQNDTLIGNAVYYYPNKIVQAIGNTQNGIYQNFDKSGRIEGINTYANGHIIRRQIFYADSLKREQAVFIHPTPFLSEDLKNSTNLKVDILFSNYKAPTREYEIISGATFSISDSCLTIRFGNIIYWVKPEGLYQCRSCADYDSNNDVPVPYFGTNIEFFTNENNEEDVRYFERDDVVPSKDYKIIVHREDLNCDDTGNNPLTIEYKGKKVSISNLKNVQVFEYDVNKNGLNVIYIISFESCEGRYKILRVS